MSAMTASLARTGMRWWVVLIEGIALLILGILLITDTGATVVSLVYFLGLWWLIGGIMDIVSLFIDRTAWGWKLVSGIIGILAGILIMQHPLWSAILVPTFLVTLLGIFGIVIGAVGIVRAFTGDGWPAAILGIFSILFGLILWFNPLVAGLGIALTLGVLGILGGIITIWQSFQVKKMEKA